MHEASNQQLVARALEQTRYHLFPGGRKKIELLVQVVTEALPSPYDSTLPKRRYGAARLPASTYAPQA
jgi:hypothetical protein